MNTPNCVNIGIGVIDVGIEDTGVTWLCKDAGGMLRVTASAAGIYSCLANVQSSNDGVLDARRGWSVKQAVITLMHAYRCPDGVLHTNKNVLTKRRRRSASFAVGNINSGRFMLHHPHRCAYLHIAAALPHYFFIFYFFICLYIIIISVCLSCGHDIVAIV